MKLDNKNIEILSINFFCLTSLMNLSKKLGFDSEFLQVGYDALLHKDFNFKRKNTINFIGSYTLKREMILQNLRNHPLEIYRLKWNKLKFSTENWTIHLKKSIFLH